MRPPDLPGGNTSAAAERVSERFTRFNEAAGFTRRKRTLAGAHAGQCLRPLQ